jgi:hypothetical protein
MAMWRYSIFRLPVPLLIELVLLKLSTMAQCRRVFL